MDKNHTLKTYLNSIVAYLICNKIWFQYDTQYKKFAFWGCAIAQDVFNIVTKETVKVEKLKKLFPM